MSGFFGWLWSFRKENKKRRGKGPDIAVVVHWEDLPDELRKCGYRLCLLFIFLRAFGLV
jgi:hypothetical protein